MVRDCRWWLFHHGSADDSDCAMTIKRAAAEHGWAVSERGLLETPYRPSSSPQETRSTLPCRRATQRFGHNQYCGVDCDGTKEDLRRFKESVRIEYQDLSLVSASRRALPDAELSHCCHAVAPDMPTLGKANHPDHQRSVPPERISLERGLEGSQMGKVVVVTSGKGGVGKTTSTAALGAALARSGHSVVVVDFDVGLRNLDLVMGAERRVVFDLINVMQGEVKLAQALVRDKRLETLYLLAASQTRDKDALTEDGIARVIADLRETFDWVICDSPAGIERGALLAMRNADLAVVVTNPEVSSVRDSDRIIGMLDSKTLRAEKG
jgi:Mrp family chromosome partitioning ATPase